MTLVTTPSIRERLNYNFVNLFKLSGRTDLPIQGQQLNSAVDRLVKHELLSIKSLSVAKADAIFLVDRYDITIREATADRGYGSAEILKALKTKGTQTYNPALESSRRKKHRRSGWVSVRTGC